MKSLVCGFALSLSMGLGWAGSWGNAQAAQAPLATPGTTRSEATDAPPELDGRAVLSVGTSSYQEGKDFHLLASSAAWAAGTLVQVSAAQLKALLTAGPAAPRATPPASSVEGRFVLAPELPAGVPAKDVVNALSRGGAVAVVLVEGDSTRAMFASQESKTRVEVQGVSATPPIAVITVTPDQMHQLLGGKDDRAATLAVHVLPAAAPRRTT